MSLRDKILHRITELTQTNETRRKELTIAVEHVHCFQCMDSKQSWKVRDNVFWARMDGRGDYDVIHNT